MHNEEKSERRRRYVAGVRYDGAEHKLGATEMTQCKGLSETAATPRISEEHTTFPCTTNALFLYFDYGRRVARSVTIAQKTHPITSSPEDAPGATKTS